MSEDRFETLIAETNWSKVGHAYGPANDVPDQLRDLAGTDSEVRREALDCFYGNIFHQGTRYPATVAAVPCLIELAKRKDHPDLAEILILLNCLAVGFHTSFLHGGFDSQDEGFRKHWKRNAAGKSYQAVQKGAEVYLDHLNHPDPMVRRAVPFHLAFFREFAETSIPRFLEALDSEKDPEVLADLLIAIGMLASVAGIDIDRELFGRRLDDANRFIRASAVIGLAYCDPRSIGRDQISILEAATEDLELRKTQSPWNDGDLGGLANIMIKRVGEYTSIDVLDALVKGLANAPDGSAGLDSAVSLLGHLFPEPVDSRWIPNQLNKDQLAGLEAIYLSDEAWHFGNFNLIMSEYQLPGERESLGRFLGKVKSGVYDQVLTLEHEGAEREYPVWVWSQLVADELVALDEFAEAIVSQWRLQTAVDVCVGPLDQAGLSSPMKIHGPGQIDLLMEVLPCLGEDVYPVLLMKGEEIVSQNAWLRVPRLCLSVMLIRLGRDKAEELPGLVDRLMEGALPKSPANVKEMDYALAEEVLTALPVERREALLLSVDYPQWQLYHTAPTREVFEYAISIIHWVEAEPVGYLARMVNLNRDLVVEGLSRGPAVLREILATILRDSRIEENVDTLFSLLGDKSAKVRRASIDSLLNMPRDWVMERIDAALTAARKVEREAASELKKALG